MASRVWKLALGFLLLAAAADLGLAQRTTATFAGIVTDPSGAVLPGADIQLVNEGTAAVMQALTNETGEFVFSFVPVASYTLKIAMPGFKGYESRNIPLGAAQNVRRTYVLAVGSVADSVTVTGEAPMVNTLSPEQRMSLETLEVKSLPMVNRNITNILEVGSGLTRADPASSGTGGTRFRMNGLGGSSMSITANGTDGNGNAGTTSISEYGGSGKIDVMSSESVAEVQVIKGVMSAEYGNAMGGNMSLITKSGTNAWHGSLFHRYEGSVFSARQPNLARRPSSVWNQFGGSLGGPIKHDKAFFFFAYEGYRQRSSIALNPTVPTPLFRNILLTSLPFAETRTLLDYYPLPNEAYAADALLARWIGPGVRQNDDDHFDWKVDYLVGGGNLSLAFSGGHPYQREARSQPFNPQVFTTGSERASLNYVISRGGSTSMTRVGYNRNLAERIDQFWYEKDPNKTETIPGLRRIKGFSYPGLTGLSKENHTRGTVPSWSFEEQLALLRGTHSWKFGGILSIPQGALPDTSAGAVSYRTLQDVMQNEPDSVAYSGGVNPHKWRLINIGFFLQDDWRASRKLVLNLGLRYDRYGRFTVKPWHEDLPVGLFNLDGLIDPVNFIWGPPRPVDKPLESDSMSLGPRIGFAYTLDNRGDFVVRGGFGVNFQGYDPQSYETYLGRTADLPNRRTFNRAESVARGLKWPVYEEDMLNLLKVEANGQPAPPGNRFNPNMTPPYAMNYTLGFQRALTSNLVLEVGYVGTRGVKFNLTRTYNLENRVTGIRPNPADQSGPYMDNSQQTNYNSLQTSLRLRTTHGLLFNIHHTYGKAMSYTGGDIAGGFFGDTRGGIEDFDNIKIERSPSTGDVTHSVIVDWVYQIPSPFAASSIGEHVLGGWQLSGIWKASTGTPISITQTGGRPDLVNLAGAINDNCCGYGNLQYLNPAAFQLVPVNNASSRTIRRGFTGNAPLRGPGQTNINLSLGKDFSLGERRTLELKADMQNALNQTQYTSISTNMSGINFGQATGTASARVIQLQLRLAF